MIDIACKAYFRRRGWLAWHTAMLIRQDGKSFPSLGDLTGEARNKRTSKVVNTAELKHNMKLFKAALEARKGG
jgi:hypothetical protein